MGNRRKDPAWLCRLKEEIERLEAQNQRLKAIVRRLRTEKNSWAERARHDPLTGLLNRRGFKKQVEPFLKAAKAFKSGGQRRKSFVVENLALIVFDIDRFRRLNSTHGHLGGDAVLQAFAGLLGERVRAVDFAARWGGEEFVVGLVGSSREEAFKVAEEIRERVEKMVVVWHPRPGHGRSATFTVSAGVADFTSAHDFEELFEQADSVLMRAKREGRNRVIVRERPNQPSLSIVS